MSKRFLKTLWRISLAILIFILFFIVNLDPIQNPLYNIGYQLYSLPSRFLDKIIQPEMCNKLNLEFEVARLQKENQQLKGEIQLVGDSKFKYITASLSQITQFKGEEAFIVRAGYKDGVQVGDFVIKEKNLLGRLVQVSETLSVIAPLGSSSLKIPAMILPSKQNCLLGKNLQNSHDLELNISYLQGNQTLEEGNLVISSWQENLPFGVEIGYLIKREGKFRVKSPKPLINTQLVQILIKDVGDHNHH